MVCGFVDWLSCLVNNIVDVHHEPLRMSFAGFHLEPNHWDVLWGDTKFNIVCELCVVQCMQACPASLLNVRNVSLVQHIQLQLYHCGVGSATYHVAVWGCSASLSGSSTVLLFCFVLPGVYHCYHYCTSVQHRSLLSSRRKQPRQHWCPWGEWLVVPFHHRHHWLPTLVMS